MVGADSSCLRPPADVRARVQLRLVPTAAQPGHPHRTVASTVRREIPAETHRGNHPSQKQQVTHFVLEKTHLSGFVFFCNFCILRNRSQLEKQCSGGFSFSGLRFPGLTWHLHPRSRIACTRPLRLSCPSPYHRWCPTLHPRKPPRDRNCLRLPLSDTQLLWGNRFFVHVDSHLSKNIKLGHLEALHRFSRIFLSDCFATSVDELICQLQKTIAKHFVSPKSIVLCFSNEKEAYCCSQCIKIPITALAMETLARVLKQLFLQLFH